MQQFTAIIIGSGFGGQAAAVNLRRIGIDDFLILERRPWMGGTWSQNSYPGAAVDVQSPLYSLSFEPYPWTQMFADALQRLTRDPRLLAPAAALAAGRLPEALAALDRGGEQPLIVLRGDRSLDYGRVMQVMGELGRAGFTSISLVTDGSVSAP